MPSLHDTRIVIAWTPEECRDQLCWCLDGKVSEFYALLVERNQDLAYPGLVRKLEKTLWVEGAAGDRPGPIQ